MAGSERNLHIDAPNLLPRHRRFTDAALTALMWGFYTYLWVPLISLFAWLLGFEFAYNVLVRAGGLQVLQDVMLIYGLMIILIIVVVSGWSIMNRRRFSRRNRRKAIDPVTDEGIAAHFGITAGQLATLRRSRIVRLRLGESGEMQQVEPYLMRVDSNVDLRLAARPEAAVAENEASQNQEEAGSMIQRSR